jgi:hypothetical protein
LTAAARPVPWNERCTGSGIGPDGSGIFPTALLMAQGEGLAIDAIFCTHRKLLPCAVSGDADDG